MTKKLTQNYDFSQIGSAIKQARVARRESRKNVSDDMNISPRYLANIENNGQMPSLQIFYELVTRYDLSVDRFFYKNDPALKSPERLNLDAVLDGLSADSLRVLLAAAEVLAKNEKEYTCLKKEIMG